MVQWLRAQNDYTRRLLDAIPGRADLARRIEGLSNAGPSVRSVQLGGARVFYLKRDPGEEVFKLYVRDSMRAPERLLVDPERLRQPGGPHWSLDYYTPSWDGRYAAYGVSPAGSENSILRVIDLTTCQILPDSIDRAQFGITAWRPDGRSFFYHRLRALPAGAPPMDRYRRSRVYLHTLGQPDSADVPILGIGVSDRVPLGEDDFPFITTIPGSTWAIAGAFHGVQNEIDAFVAPLADVRDARVQWRQLVAVADSVTNFDVHGDDIYLLSHHQAPRFKVLRTSLRAPDVRNATVVAPPTEAVIKFFGAARDALYIQKLDGGLARLERRPYDAAAARAVALPIDGAITALVTSNARDGALFALGGWTQSSLWYAVHPASGRVTDTGLKPPSSADFSNIAVEELRIPSHDGTMVPLSIVHRRDLPRDGTNPTLLDGYGAYGFSYDPAYDPRLLAWLGRGGVFAVCHVRGGGEFGEAWHKAGQRATKANTWRDFIACAEYLVQQKWTTPGRLAGRGTSAGGIQIGMAVTERPDLFRAAVPRVGTLNPLRAMQVGVGGPANRPEFGDPTTAEGFRELLGMDTYHHVRPGTAYPALLITSGMNDPRVDAWIPAKTAARFQAATSSARPVLLRVEFAAGHGMGSSISQYNAELADTYAFLLWQFGVVGFQPAVP